MEKSESRLPKASGKTILPDGGMNLPGGKTVLPAGGMDLPARKMELPGGGAIVPGGEMDLPADKMKLPGGGTNLPDGKTGLAGVKTDRPALRRPKRRVPPNQRPDFCMRVTCDGRKPAERVAKFAS